MTNMTKAEAKRQIAAILDMYKPWDKMPDTTAEELHRLRRIAYPTGIPLPRI